MTFQKGHTPWNIGKVGVQKSTRKGLKLKPLSEEHKRKISKASRGEKHHFWGKYHSQESKKKMSIAHKGKVFSKQSREKMSIAHLGEKNHFFGKKHTEETKKKIGLIHKGKKISDAQKKIISETHKGEKNYFWKGGINPINNTIRKSKEYDLWRKEVFTRDNYTCIWCNDRQTIGHKVILNADHIKPFAYYPELRFSIDNGRTLCISCHRKTDTYSNKLKVVVAPNSAKVKK